MNAIAFVVVSSLPNMEIKKWSSRYAGVAEICCFLSFSY